MGDSFDSTSVINKRNYDQFVREASKLAIAVYTIPAFTWLNK
jgi:hypothetical protein